MSETQLTYEGEWDTRDMLKLSRVTIHGQVIEIPIERNFASIESIQTYVDKVLALNWVKATYPRAAHPLKVVHKKLGTANVANCGSGVMQVPMSTVTRWALREIVVLHEVAHHLTASGHDVRFRECFAHLVEELIGVEAAWILRVHWMDSGLKVVQAS